MILVLVIGMRTSVYLPHLELTVAGTSLSRLTLMISILPTSAGKVEVMWLVDVLLGTVYYIE